MTEERIKVVIERDRWQRTVPEKNGMRFPRQTTGLLNATGNMCCLGFASAACGASKRLLRRSGAPSGVICERSCGEALTERLERLMDVEDECIRINDVPLSSGCVSSAEQETMIAQALATVGFDVEFVGGELTP